MSGKKIGIVLALDGERAFSQSAQNARKESANLKSELKKLTTEYDGNANSQEFLIKKQENLIRQTETYTNTLKNAKAGLENAQNVQKRAAQRYEELKKSLEEARKEQEKMISSGKDGSKEYKEQEKKVSALEQAVEKQGLQCQKCEGKVSDWSKRVNDAENNLEKTDRELKKNATYLKEAEDATDKCATSIDKFGKAAEEATETVSGWGEKLTSAVVAKGVSMATDAVMQLKDAAVDAGKYVVEVGSDFEAAMSEVQAISGSSGTELDAITEKAKELGASTKFSATEVAEGFKYMSLAGWSTSSMLSGIDGVLNLAAASGMELAEASDMVTDYLAAFGLQAADSAHMADMLAYAQAHSNTSAQQLGDAYGNCAAILHSGGQDIETVTSLLEGMANQGLKGSEAGTSLSSIMTQITQKMKDGKIAIGDTAVQVADSNGNFRDMTDIITDIDAALEGMGTQERSAALGATFNKTAISGLNLILNEGIEKVAGYENALRNSGGAAQEMADIMNDNLKGDLTEAKSALEGLGIAAYDYIDGPVRGVVQGVTGVIQGITEVITPQRDAIDDLTDAVKNAKENVENIDLDFTDATDSADRVAALGARLEELNSVENRSTVQKQEMAAIVEELSGSIPELQGAYDAERDTLSATNTELEALISNYQKTAVQQAALAATQELVNQKMEAQVQIDKAQDQKDRAESRLKLLEKERDLITQIQEEQWAGEQNTDYKTEAVKLYKQALDDGIITMDEYHQAEEKIANAQMGNRLAMLNGELYDGGDAAGIMHASINELADQIDTCNGVMKEQGKITEDCDQKIGEYTKTAEKMYGADKNILEASKDYSDASEIEAQRHEQLAKRTLETAKANKENAEATGEATDALEEQTEVSKTAAEAQKSAMESLMDTYHSTVESIKSDLQDKINPFEKFDVEKDKGQDVTVEKMTENLDSQIEAFENYQKNLEAVKDHVGNEISPEFMKYIEDMGMDGANMLEHILQTFADEEPEKVKELNDKWLTAMDQTENIAKVGAANQAALQMATGELGSTEADFSQLQESINSAVEAAGEGWSGLSEKTRQELDTVVQVAKECGVKIPDGLAEGIASGETSAEDAIAQIQGSIQGGFDALVKMAEDAGVKLPKDLAEGISSGKTSAVDSYAAIIQAISEKSPELQQAMVSAVTTATEAAGEAAENTSDSIVLNPDSITSQTGEYEEAGKTLGEATGSGIATGVRSRQEEISTAISDAIKADGVKTNGSGFQSIGESVAESIADGIRRKADMVSQAVDEAATAAAGNAQKASQAYQKAGNDAMTAYGQGIAAGRSAAQQQAGQSGSQAVAAVRAYQGSFSGVGSNMMAGMASGINAGRSAVINASTNAAAAALAAAKAKLDIHSPSRKFKNEVGKQIPAGMAFGIADNASLAGNAADQMSAQVYTKATAWLSSYKKKQKVSLEDEKWYWSQVLKHTKQGTDAYNDATASMIVAGVSKTKTTGSGKKKKATKKDAETYYSEIYSSAEKYMSNMESLNDVSTKDQLAYWQSMAKQLKSGTTAWYNAQAKIKSIQAKIGTVSNMSNMLSSYKTYYDVSEKAEMDYWDLVRKNYAEGTEERLEADEKYLDAREKYYDKLTDLEDDYKDKVEEVNKKLADDIAELDDKYKSSLSDREKAIKDAFGLFDEFTSESADGKTLLFNIKTQAAGYEDWMQQIQELSGKGILNQDLMDELVDQGPEISAAIHALNSLTEEELKEYNQAYLEKSELARKQAEKDSEKLKKEIEAQTAELNKQAEKEKAELESARNTAIEKVNTALSSSMTALGNNARSIADDQTAKLIAAITGEQRKEGMESTASVASSGSVSSGAQTAAVAPAPAPAATPAVSEDKILKIINSGKGHAKSLSKQEKKDHVALWEYIVKKYGHVPTNSIYTKLAKELGVKVSKTVTSAQKNEILKKLKAKGYRSGGRIWDDLTWMDEDLDTKGPEMIVRKADNAILTRTKPGDEIINADTAANLAQIGKYSLDELKQLIQNQGAATYLQNLRIPAGIAKANQLMDIGSMNGLTQNISTQRVEQMLQQMNGLLEECLPYVRKIGQQTQIVLDDGTLVGKMAEPMDRAITKRRMRYRG